MRNSEFNFANATAWMVGDSELPPTNDKVLGVQSPLIHIRHSFALSAGRPESRPLLAESRRVEFHIDVPLFVNILSA